MGITNLTGWIKATDGVEEDLTKKRCEVDFASMFFALVNSLSFHKTVQFAAKSARCQLSTHTTTSTQQTSSGPERAADVDGAGMSTHTTTSTRQASSSPKRAADVDDADTADTASSNKRLRPLQISSGSSTLVEDMQRLLATQPSQIRFDESGALTTICAQEKVIVSTINHTIWRKAKWIVLIWKKVK
jgi:hypothetical protein